MGIKLNTAKQAFPMIYAYSTPQIADHNGWTKIGYTEEQDVETRIKQQTHTSYNNNYGLRRGSQPRLFPSQSRSC